MMCGKISIIIPCRNEEKFIEKVIKSILNQTYPKDKLEVIFVDGMSEDRTQDIIKEYASKYPFIKLLENPYKYVPHAMNIGIKNSTGDIIIRMDAHSEYPPDYVEKLVYWLKKLNADNVGGIWINIPSKNTLEARAIAIALSSNFGIGNAHYRLGKVNRPMKVDTVPFGCYPKKVFNKIGLYDEDLIRNQDDELNARLRKIGGKIFLIPDIKIKYYARDSLKKVAKMFFQYGYFKPLVNMKIGKPTTVRQLFPPLFVFMLIIPTLFAVAVPKVILTSIFVFILHSILNIFFSLNLSIKNKDLKLFPFLFVTFLIIHLSYGLGYIKGILDFIILKLHKKKQLEVGLSR